MRSFLSLRIFGQLSSSLYLQRFDPYVLRPFSGVSLQTCDSSRKLEIKPLFNLRGLDCSNSVNHGRVQVLSYGKHL